MKRMKYGAMGFCLIKYQIHNLNSNVVKRNKHTTHLFYQFINKNKMISTKGYFYFDHLNPKHNVKTRKHSKISSTGFPLREIPVEMSKQEQTNITGITGTSYNRRFID